jgi:hypothetical protein
MINVAHPVIAVALQLIAWHFTGNMWYGVCLSALYVGRENAQAEYKWIERYGGGKRANMPFWGAFSPKVWDLKSITDVLLPVLATTVLAIVA